jgi:hypothetical protein
LENDCENDNTHAHDDFHMMVLARLRRWWCLSGSEGFGVRSNDFVIAAMEEVQI